MANLSHWFFSSAWPWLSINQFLGWEEGMDLNSWNIHANALLLFSSQIGSIENLNHLTDLRVLNLSRNCLTCVENLNGLDSLAELNLRYNQISSVVSDWTESVCFGSAKNAVVIDLNNFVTGISKCIFRLVVYLCWSWQYLASFWQVHDNLNCGSILGSLKVLLCLPKGCFTLQDRVFMKSEAKFASLDF